MAPGSSSRAPNSVEELYAMFQALREENKLLKASVSIDTREKMKIPPPLKFDGTASMLQAYMTQVRLYQRQYLNSFPYLGDRVMNAGSFLMGDALLWFEPHLRDFLSNDAAGRKPETVVIFNDLENYEKALKSAFGEVDEKRTNAKKLCRFTQRTSASKYGAEFRQAASRVDWGQEALIAQFYEGLKDHVKDEIARERNLPTNLTKYIELAVLIDDRLYERRTEKGRGKTGWVKLNKFAGKPQSNQGRRREEPIAYAHTTNPGRMDLDATTKGDKSGKKCFNCGKFGHFSRECKKPKKEWKPAPEGKKQFNATNKQEIDHKCLNWTACYDDNCITHLSDKNGSGWFPKEPRRKTLAVTTKKTIQMPNPTKPRTKREERREVQTLLKTLVRQELDEQEATSSTSVPARTFQQRVEAEVAADNELQEHLKKRCKELDQEKSSQEIPDRQTEDAGRILSTMKDDSNFEIRCVDDDYALTEPSDSDSMSFEQNTPEASEAGAEVPSLRRENATLGSMSPSDDEDSENDVPTLTEVQKQAIKRHIPAPRGKHHAIPILAVGILSAIKGEWNPRGEFADDPRIMPTHEDHRQISWASCAHLTCMTHFRTKARLDAFPVRLPGHSVTTPYLSRELVEWRVVMKYSDQTMIIEPDPNTPLACRANQSTDAKCTSVTCQLHQFMKIMEWERYAKTGKPYPREKAARVMAPCEADDHMACPEPDCTDHLVDKAREWHKWQCGTPRVYKQAKQALREYEIEDPVGSSQAQYENEQKLDQWYKNNDNKKCIWDHAINCADEHCEQHKDMKQVIYKNFRLMCYQNTCFKHALDGTGPTEWYQELQQQIRKETQEPGQTKNEKRHL